MTFLAEISKEFSFEAAHYLPNVEENHKCRNIHGHSYKVCVCLYGEVNPNMGWVMDLGELSTVVKPVIKRLDHSLLNEIEGLKNPTSENLAYYLLGIFKKKLPQIHSVTVRATGQVSVRVFATPEIRDKSINKRVS